MRTQLSIAALLLISTLVLSASRAHAQQLVLVDVTYTHSKDTTHDSHYPVMAPANTPANWTSPINYAGGQVYVRLEVKTKPSDAATRFQICVDSKPHYACTDQSPPYTATNTPDALTWATPFPNMWSDSVKVDWTQGIGSNISLILKDTNNVKPAPENVGAETSAKYLPTDLRVTVTLVPPNTVYAPPPPLPIDAGAGDASSEDAAIDASAALDAAVSSDGGLAAADGGGTQLADAGQLPGAGNGGGGASAAGTGVPPSGSAATGGAGDDAGVANNGGKQPHTKSSCAVARVAGADAGAPWWFATGSMVLGVAVRRRRRHSRC